MAFSDVRSENVAALKSNTVTDGSLKEKEDTDIVEQHSALGLVIVKDRFRSQHSLFTLTMSTRACSPSSSYDANEAVYRWNVL